MNIGERNALVVEANREINMPVDEIARRCKLSIRLVRRILQRHGIVVCDAETQRLARRDKEISRLYFEEGLTAKEIAPMFKMNWSTVYDVLRPMRKNYQGISTGKQARSQIKRRKVTSLRKKDGYNIPTIARLTGESILYITSILREEGLATDARIARDEKDERVAKLACRPGVRVSEIVRDTGYSESCIRAIIRKKGIRLEGVPIDRDWLAEQYITRRIPIKEICRVYKLPLGRVSEMLRGIVGGDLRRNLKINDQELVQLYVKEGESIDVISRIMNTASHSIKKRLVDLNVKLRTRTEWLALRYKNMTPEQRASVADAAHAAIRGVKRSPGDILKRNKFYEGKFQSENEKQVFLHLKQAGLSPYIGYPLDLFLIDLAFPEQRLAIEVDGGAWHSTGKKARQDARKANALCLLGWRVFRINVTDGKVPENTARDVQTCLGATPVLGE